MRRWLARGSRQRDQPPGNAGLAAARQARGAGQLRRIGRTEIEEFGRLFSRTTQKTADLVEENWPAIQRVAAALLSRPALTEDDIDALIAAHDH
jgi:hypothetical protein